MAKVRNDFTEDVLGLLKTATDLDHLVTFVPWLHTMAEPTIKKSAKILNQKGGPANSFGPMTALLVVDILHDGKYITTASAGKRITIGDDVDRMADEVAGRMHASLLTVLHEALEIFLKATYAKLLFHLKDKLQPPRRAAFRERTQNWREYHNTQPYFRDYAQWSCRSNCDEALGVFRKELAWKEIRVPPWNGMEWINFVQTLAFCRHCTVHNEGRVSEARWKKLNKQKEVFVRLIMRQTILANEERILPPAKITDQVIADAGTFAYGLYVLQSKRCGLQVDHALFKRVPTPKTTDL